MELLGVEFIEYARFTRQFIPLHPGITLLAGRNNTGKTLLRGLTMLNGFPLENRRKQVDLRALEFAAQKIPQPRFGMDVLLRVAQGEFREVLRIVDHGGDQKSLSDGILMRFRFSVTSAQLDFDEAVFFHPDAEVAPGQRIFQFVRPPAVRGQASQYVSEVWWPELDVKSRTELPNLGMYDTHAGQRPQLKAGFLFQELLPLMNCIFIEAHRVTTPQEAVTSTSELSPSGATLPSFLHKLLCQ